jgi:hypothetical protein
MFDVHVIASATHLDEDLRFLVTVFQSIGDQVVRFAVKNEMIEVVHIQGEVRWDLGNVAPAGLCDWVLRLKKWERGVRATSGNVGRINHSIRIFRMLYSRDVRFFHFIFWTV